MCKYFLFIFFGNGGGGLLWIYDIELIIYDEMLFFKLCISLNVL